MQRYVTGDGYEAVVEPCRPCNGAYIVCEAAGCGEEIQRGDDCHAVEDGSVYCCRQCVRESHTDPGACPACYDQPPTLIGFLGSRMHVRCRACGFDWSVDAEGAEDQHRAQQWGVADPELSPQPGA